MRSKALKWEKTVQLSVSLRIEFPAQEQVDEGEEPFFIIRLCGDAIKFDDEALDFDFDVYDILKEGLGDSTHMAPAHEESDVIAEWLETWAARLREEFPKP